MKKGRLSRNEREFILQNKHLAPEKLAIETGRSIELVKDVLANIPKQTPAETQKILRESGKKRNARVMTPAASEIADATRSAKKMDPSIIHKPFGND